MKYYSTFLKEGNWKQFNEGSAHAITFGIFTLTIYYSSRQIYLSIQDIIVASKKFDTADLEEIKVEALSILREFLEDHLLLLDEFEGLE